MHMRILGLCAQLLMAGQPMLAAPMPAAPRAGCRAPEAAQLRLAAPLEAPLAPEGEAVGGAVGLDEAVAITLRLLPALAGSAAAADAARARIISARAAYLPALTGAMAYSRQTANYVLRPGMLPVSLTGAASSVRSRGQSYNYWSLSLQLSQLVFDFGQTSATIGQARALARQSTAAVQQATLDAALATRRAYFAAQGRRRLLAVAQQTLHNQARHQAQIAGQVAVGQRPSIDLAQAQTDWANARVACLTALSDAAVAHATLAQAMGLEGMAPLPAVTDDTLPEVQGEAGPWQALLDEALAARPELRALEAAVQAQHKQLRARVAGLLPQLGATGQLTDAGQDIERLGWNWSVGALLSWPLLSGGQGVGQIREAQALLRQAQASRDAGRQAIRLDLTQAHQTLQSARPALEAAQLARCSARKQLALAEGRYSAGLGSGIELSDAQLAWATAEGQRVQAEVALATARAALLRALGRA